VLAGAGAAGLLSYGLYSFVTNKSAVTANRAMRGRVLAQGAALVGLAAYAGYSFALEDKEAAKRDREALAALNHPPAHYKHHVVRE
jgi:hypothetical protein